MLKVPRFPLAIDVVVGNHDRHGGHALAEIATWHRDGFIDGAFEFRHEPAAAADRHVLAGHLLPVIRIDAFGGDHARLPAFWSRYGTTVPPAFGTFTGGARIRPEPGERAYAIAGKRVVEVPVRRAAT